MFFNQREAAVYRSVDLEAVTCKKMLKIEQNQIHSLTLSGDEKTVFRLAGKGLVCDNAERIRDKKVFTVTVIALAQCDRMVDLETV